MTPLTIGYKRHRLPPAHRGAVFPLSASFAGWRRCFWSAAFPSPTIRCGAGAMMIGVTPAAEALEAELLPSSIST